MSGKLFLKNRLPVILLNLLGALALSLFLLALGNDIQTILFILAAWMLVLVLYLAAGYASRKKRLEKLLEMATQLKERYLLPEVMPVPDQAEEQVYYQLLKLAGKSMLERIGEVERERGEYRTYIEQWVHEVKTPITALKLLCENNRSPFSREVLAELEKLVQLYETVIPIASEISAFTDTRFGTSDDLMERLEDLTGHEVLCDIPSVEPIGPKGLLDVLVIAPATGNTIAKLAAGITDTAVTMAAKAHLRNGRPVVIAMASNDGLAAGARNIGELLVRKNYYFVPFGQDNARAKPSSLVADFSKIPETVEAALTRFFCRFYPV